MLKKTAVILCGGRGTRLGALGNKTPKALIKIQNYPIIWFIINELKRNNFNHFTLPIGFKGSQIKRYIKNNKNFNKDNFDMVNTGINSTISERIYKIKKYIKSDYFLILNGDAIFNSDINKIYNSHLKSKAEMSFICCETKADFGTVGIKNNKIVDFQRNTNFDSVTAKVKKNYSGYVYSGMSIISKKILNENFVNKPNFEKDFYPHIIKKFFCKMSPIDGFWYAMDNMKDIHVINKKKQNKEMFNKIKNLKNKYLSHDK